MTGGAGTGRSLAVRSFAFIAEQIPTELAAHLAEELDQPVITLGGGRANDGVYHISGDLVGYSAFPIPKNRGAYANVGAIIEDALTRYRDDCVSGAYPLAENDVRMAPEELSRFEAEARTNAAEGTPST